MPNILTPRPLRRRLFAAIAAGALALTTAACGGGGASGNGGSATSGNLIWWGWTPQPESATAYIAAFNKVYPNIHVQYKQQTIAGYDAALRPALASSVGPDLYNVAPGAVNGSVEIYHGEAADLLPSVEKALGSNWKSQLAPLASDPMMYDGKLVGVSVGSTFTGPLWINKDLFDKYHVTPPTTLSQWVQDCQVFKANHVGCFVHGAGQAGFDQDMLQAIIGNIQPGLWTQLVTAKAKWTDPRVVQALTIWKQLFNDGIMEPGALGLQQYPDANNAFMAQKYAMVFMGTWYMQYSTTPGMTAAISAAGVAKPKPFTQVAIPFPDVAGTGHTGAIYGDVDYGLAVNPKSKNRNAAITFATWLGTSTAGQQVVANILNDFPTLKSVQPQWGSIPLVNAAVQQPELQKLAQQADAVNEPRTSQLTADLQQAIENAATTVAAGKASPTSAATTLESAAEKN